MRAFLLPSVLLMIFGGLFGVTKATEAQDLELSEVMVSLDADYVSLGEALGEIERQTELSFAYSYNAININREVSVKAEQLSVEQILKRLFTSHNVSWALSDKTIFLKKWPEIEQQPTVEELVTGQVTDAETGERLPGVNILVKGTSTGTFTGTEGDFELMVPALNDTLVFSYIGYQTQEVPINGRTELDIQLVPQTVKGGEMVVVGYGEQRKSDLTGSVASVSPEDVSNTPTGSFEKLLQGSVTGLRVINRSEDNPEGGATVRIRGISSINGSNSPLVVVDGFPLGDAGNLNSINPNNIASIEVLKDASASAIYGSRGANGVILVTTKDGDADGNRVFVNTKTSIAAFSKELDYWEDPVKMARLENEARINQGLEPLYRGEKDVNGTYYPSVHELRSNEWPYYTDWTDYVFRNASTMDYNLGVEGNSKQTNYYAMVGYYRGQGMQVEDDYSKMTGKLRINQQIFENLKIKGQVSFIKGNRNLNYGLNYRRNPLYPVYNADGSYYRMNNRDFGNVAALTEERVNERESTISRNNLGINWDILPYLNLNTRVSYQYHEEISSAYDPPLYTLNGDNHDGFANRNNYKSGNIVAESFMTFSQDFINIHSLEVTGGFSYENNINKSSYLEARGFTNQNLKEENLQGGDTKIINNDYTETTLASAIGRVNYQLKNRYLFTFTSRLDGSSKFGANNKWAFFPSGAVGWRITEEKFMQSDDIFNDLKLRVSYGISGNQGISPYQTMERYGSEFYYTGGEEYITYGIGLPIGRQGPGDRFLSWGGIANESLSWETTAQLDAGLDMSVLDGRIAVTADYYYKKTSDLLRQQFLPLSTGFDRIWINDGEIVNRGVEFSVEGNIISNRNFNFNGTLNFTKNSNEVIDIGSQESSGYIEDEYGNRFQYYGDGLFDQTAANVLAIGHPVNVFYGYKVDGIIQEGSKESDLLQPGEYNYVDLNNDGTIDSNDRTIIGDPNPDFVSSLSLKMSHSSGLDLQLQIYGVYGNEIFSQSKIGAPRFQDNRWTPDNTTNQWPSLRSGRQYRVSDWFIEDGSFLRLQNVNIGYNLTNLQLGWLSGGRVYINGTNLITLSGVSEYDPEVGEKGIGNVPFPRISTYTLGINLKF